MTIKLFVPSCIECSEPCLTILEDTDSGGRCLGCRELNVYAIVRHGGVN